MLLKTAEADVLVTDSAETARTEHGVGRVVMCGRDVVAAGCGPWIAHRDGMDSADLGNDGTAEAGDAYAGESCGLCLGDESQCGSDCVEHVLRHAALRRAAYFSARSIDGNFAGGVERSGAGGGFSCAGRCAWSYAYIGHAFALATRADESVGRPHCAGIYSHVRGDCGPGDSEPGEGAVSASAGSSTHLLRQRRELALTLVMD